MRDDLVAVEIEIDPFRGRPALWTTQQSTVESARFLEAGDGKRKMKWYYGHECSRRNDKPQFTAHLLRGCAEIDLA